MRAQRFPLRLTARYRPLGSHEWLQGETQNISASGVLLESMRPLQVDTRVELTLALASDKSTTARGEVACTGRVVRIVEDDLDTMHASFAVSIEQYNFTQLAQMMQSRPD